MKQITNRALRTSGILGALLVLCLILFSGSVQADELTEQEVRAAVQTWVRYVTADARPDAVIERMEPHQVKGETVAYIAHLSGGGFCLCGADDLVLPVYLYSPHGTHDPDNPNYQYVLWEIAARTESLRKASREGAPKLQQYQGALTSRASSWQELIAGTVPEKVKCLEAALGEPVQMELDLTCLWHQDSPYNDQCPDLNPGADEHCLVGCVATATAQIMYYWKWPNTGQDSDYVIHEVRWIDHWIEKYCEEWVGIPYDPVWTNRLEMPWDSDYLRMNGYWDESIYKEAQAISSNPYYMVALETLYEELNYLPNQYDADFGATNYHWSILEDEHTDEPLDAGDVEVAKLCYHVGVAVDTEYQYFGSGACIKDVPSALESYFRYDTDAVYDNCGDDTEGALIEEIQWLRPVVYRGRRAPGGIGHAWVVFGYNTGMSPTEFKINMGQEWCSVHWYILDHVWLNSDIFKYQQAHITRIAPKDVVKFVGNTEPGDGSPDNPYENIEEAVAEVPDGATLIFKAGSINTFSGDPLVINRPLTLKGYNVIIQKE